MNKFQLISVSTALMLILCYSFLFAEENEIKIKFTSAHPDSYGYYAGGFSITATRFFIPRNEKIKKYPENYKVQKTYYMSLQLNQYYFSLAHNSEKDYQTVIGVFKQDWFEKAKLKYTKKYVDCLVSFAILKNNKNQDIVVFDQNNDEDLSNDQILKFQKETLKNGNHTRDVECVKTIVSTDFFDGEKTQSSKFPVKLVKTYSARSKMDHLTLALQKFEIGAVSVNGKEYRVALFNGKDIEYDKYSSFWLDMNQNNRQDKGDVTGQMHKPFTILGQTYEVTFIDRFGKYITLEESDMKVVPPLSLWMPAPDFEAVTLDSTQFQLSKMKGKFILIDFWGTWCMPCLAEIPHLKQAHEKYSGKDFQIVSIGVDDPAKLKSFVQKRKLNWIHIQQNKNSAIEKLYQISGYPSAFLVSKKGIIIAEGDDLRGEKLMTTLEKFVD